MHHDIMYYIFRKITKINPFLSTSEYTLHSVIPGPVVKIWFYVVLWFASLPYYSVSSVLGISVSVCWQRQLRKEKNRRAIHCWEQFPLLVCHQMGPTSQRCAVCCAFREACCPQRHVIPLTQCLTADSPTVTVPPSPSAQAAPWTALGGTAQSVRHAHKAPQFYSARPCVVSL